MVNTGKRSRGCLTCRRRRVKCDETHPECIRCTKLGVECHWKDEWSSMVRHQENWAKKTVVERVMRVQNLRNERAASAASNPRSGYISTTGHVTYPPAHTCYLNTVSLSEPRIGPDTYVIEQFFTDYGLRAENCPFLDMVHTLYVNSPTKPTSIHSVLSAVALASAAKQQRRHDLMQEAHRYYGQTIKSLVKVLNDSVAAKQNATLLTIYLMGLYEIISLDRQPGMQSPWRTHGTGRIAILRLRGPEQLLTQAGRNIFLLIYTEQLIASLDTQSGEVLEECPSWMETYFAPTPFGNQVLLMHDVSIYLKTLRDVLNARIINHRRLLEVFRLGLEFVKEVSYLSQVLSDGIPAESPFMRMYVPMERRSSQGQFNFKPFKTKSIRVKTGAPLAVRTRSQTIALSDITSVLTNSPSPDLVSFGSTRDTSQGRSTPFNIENVENIEGPENIDSEATIRSVASPTYEVIALENALEDFKSSKPATRRQQQNERALFFSVTYSIIGNNCRAMEISLLQCLLAALPLIAPDDFNAPHIDIDALRTEWETTIASRAIEICENYPYGLGERDAYGNRLGSQLGGITYRAYMSLWCLRTALGVPQTPCKYKVRLAKWMKSIADVMGIGMAADFLTNAEERHSFVADNATYDRDPEEDIPKLTPPRSTERMFWTGLYRDDIRNMPLYMPLDKKQKSSKQRGM